jgi:hypothetical protein
METRTRKVDSKARTTLFRDFAGCFIIVERVSSDELRVRKLRRASRKYSLAQLVAGITKKNRHAEIPTGRPVGGEVW